LVTCVCRRSASPSLLREDKSKWRVVDREERFSQFATGPTRNSDADRVARTGSLAPSAPAKRGRGTTGARVASEPWWRGRRSQSFVFVAEDSLREKKRANMSGHHESSCGALSPAPPPPPCFAGWSPSPAIAGADEARPLRGGEWSGGRGNPAHRPYIKNA
jgi:hypothetical protein